MGDYSCVQRPDTTSHLAPHTSLSLSRSEEASEVSEVVRLWFRSEDETSEERAESWGQAGDRRGAQHESAPGPGRPAGE